jgi:hypothetical protein
MGGTAVVADGMSNFFLRLGADLSGESPHDELRPSFSGLRQLKGALITRTSISGARTYSSPATSKKPLVRSSLMSFRRSIES